MSDLLMMPLPQRSEPIAPSLPARFPKINLKLVKTPPTITAIESVEPLQGSTRPHLMRGDDGQLYVVKSPSNPFGHRILVNEFLATQLARELGLAVPEVAFVHVPDGLGQTKGLNFGSRFCRNRSNSCVHSWLPSAVWGLVQNPRDLIGAYVFDTWNGNADPREVIFARRTGTAPFRMFLIDHSHCFGGGAWRFHNVGAPCPTMLKFAYRSVESWADLDPWIISIEMLDPSRIEGIVAGIPREWLINEGPGAVMQIIHGLMERRFRLRSILASVLNRGGHPFTNWRFRSTPFLVPSLGAFGKTA